MHSKIKLIYKIIVLLLLFVMTPLGLKAEIITQAISGTLPANGYVENDYKITPDGQYVVFVGDIDTQGTFDLYSVPVGGGIKPLKLSDVNNGTSIIKFEIGSDNRIVYNAAEDLPGVHELYRVHPDGTGKEKLNPPFTDGFGFAVLDRDVNNFRISPDASRVVYTADRDTNNVTELYSVLKADIFMLHNKLNDSLVAGGHVFQNFQISEDSNHVIYLADQDTDEQNELYTVPIGGGVVKKLNFGLVADGDVQQFKLSNDFVIYKADELVDGKNELFRVPVGDGTRTKMNADMGDDQDVWQFEIYRDSNDSSNDYVIYRADQDTDEVWELYSVNLPNSATRTKLSGDLPDGANVSTQFDVSPNGQHVVFRANRSDVDVHELYVTPIGGGPIIKRNDPLVAGGNVSSFTIAPDSSRIVYWADQQVDGKSHLYSVPLVGGAVAVSSGASVKLSDDLVESGSIANYSFTPDSSRVLYKADVFVQGQYDLFSVPSTGGMVQQVNGSLTAEGEITDYLVTPDSNHIIYRADQNIDEQFELFSVSETAPTVQFSNPEMTTSEASSEIQIRVTLSAPSFKESSVNYIISGGTATPGEDYNVLAGAIIASSQSATKTLIFPPGNTSQSIPIAVMDDDVSEDPETAIFSLVTPQNAAIGTNESHTLTIMDGVSTLYLPIITRP